MNSRTERDSFGTIEVPTNHFWGAQTQRSLLHFHISTERMPEEIIFALAEVKSACARVNCDLGLLKAEKAKAIIDASEEVLNGIFVGEFPLSVWQTGSGTQSNMNEVLANRASELFGGAAELLNLYIQITMSISVSHPTIIDMETWKTIKQIKTAGPGFYMRSHENTRYAWTDGFATSNPESRDTMTLIDKDIIAVLKRIAMS